MYNVETEHAGFIGNDATLCLVGGRFECKADNEVLRVSIRQSVRTSNGEVQPLPYLRNTRPCKFLPVGANLKKSRKRLHSVGSKLK